MEGARGGGGGERQTDGERGDRKREGQTDRKTEAERQMCKARERRGGGGGINR